MSKVLLVRHLPTALSFNEKEELLKHFGAEKVWEVSRKKHFIFAEFSSIELAKESLRRLHQLEVGKRRLVVEYSSEQSPTAQDKPYNEKESVTGEHLKEFLRCLNAWNPSVNFYQPPPVHLNYEYPEPNKEILINILYTLSQCKPFYYQTLHLMNKMSLNSPFQYNENAVTYFTEILRSYFSDDLLSLKMQKAAEKSSDIESEISSDDNQDIQQVVPPNIMKRKNVLPKTRKRLTTMLATATLPKVKKKTEKQEVFDNVKMLEPKKISVVIPQDSLNKMPEDETEIIGEIRKLETETSNVIKKVEVDDSYENMNLDENFISKKELFQNRISYSDMKHLPIFKNYHPGEPSMRLYLKNLAKKATEKDIIMIYGRYVKDLSKNEQQAFDVRIMQEGRMKGQGFVTFPSTAIAELALNETNGYILKDKPMVVQFARVATKKSVT